ncbi:MAG: dicarboxylate/amino acid:cation symporter [Alphaproteobacteria bacterium]|nr:dicarboxylate/amino acid:cation symporter [Rickettsiales bacterium]
MSLSIKVTQRDDKPRKCFLTRPVGQILLCLFLGVVLGVVFRFYPSQMSAFFLNPEDFRFLGNLFIRLVRMLVGPLIFASVFSSIVSMGNSKKTGKVFLFSILTFVVMTLISVLISLFVINKLQVGHGINFDKDTLINSGSVSQFASKAVRLSSFSDFILTIVPFNMSEAFRTDNFLHIIFFATVMAFAATSIGSKATPFVSSINSLSEILLKLSSAFSKVAPLGIFGFTFWIIGTQDIVLLKSLMKFVLVVYGICMFLMFILYPLFILIVFSLNPIPFVKKMFPYQIMGFLISSGSAILPNTLELTEKKLGVSKEKAQLIIPIGATLNMNGGAVYIASSAIFIAQLFGIDLSVGQYALLVLLATIAAVGTAPVPGSAIFLLAGVLLSLDLPVAAIGILLAVDRMLDMIRTATNMTGDVFSAIVISSLYKDFDKSIYNDKNAGKVV